MRCCGVVRKIFPPFAPVCSPFLPRGYTLSPDSNPVTFSTCISLSLRVWIYCMQYTLWNAGPCLGLYTSTYKHYRTTALSALTHHNT